MMIVLTYSVVESVVHSSILVIIMMLSGFCSASHMMSADCLGMGLFVILVMKGLLGLWDVGLVNSLFFIQGAWPSNPPLGA